MGSGGREPKGHIVESGGTLRSTLRRVGVAYCGVWNTLRVTFWVWGASQGAQYKVWGYPRRAQCEVWRYPKGHPEGHTG